jgi:hypothetical protein
VGGPIDAHWLFWGGPIDAHWLFWGGPIDAHWLFWGGPIDAHWLYWGGAIDTSHLQKMICPVCTFCKGHGGAAPTVDKFAAVKAAVGSFASAFTGVIDRVIDGNGLVRWCNLIGHRGLVRWCRT